MTKKRILKYSCLTLSVICGLFVCTTAIFAATQQSLSCTTIVNYDQAIKAVVEVKVGSGSYQTLFNNTDNSSSSTSTYFYLTTPPSNSSNSVSSSSPVQFKVTNYTTDKAITATVRLANLGLGDIGISIPSNVDLYTSSNIQLSYTENSTTYSNATKINKVDESTTTDYISAYANSTASSAFSTEFYVQTLFPETIVPFVITLETTS